MSDNKQLQLQRIIDSLQHPFYVIDVNNYVVMFANEACGFGELDGSATCHMITHHFATPCKGEHVCPLELVKKTKRPVKTEHVHYDEAGNPVIMEVHGDPVFDENGEVIYMVEYSFDVTDLKKAQGELKHKYDVIEKMNKLMIGREERALELKKEVNALLKELGKPLKYNSTS